MKIFLKFITHYLNPLNTFLGILISCSAISALLFYLFDHYVFELNSEIYWSSSLGVTGFCLLKFTESRIKRHNTLCYLEVELNQNMDILSNLISTLQNMIQNYTPILLPHELPFLSVDRINEVGRIDIKNNLADLLCDFRRIVQHWNNLIDFGKEHQTTITDRNDPQHNDIRIAGTHWLNIVLKRTKLTLTLVEDTLVLVRIYLRSDKPFFKFGQPFIWPCELMVDINAERKKLMAEKQGHQ